MGYGKSANMLKSESVVNGSVARGLFEDHVHLDLIADCDDYNDLDGYVEYWGTTEDGSEWRVELHRS